MSLRVLLVEDDRELRATLRQALAVEGYEVMTAASLADARAQLQHLAADQLVDLVLLDLGLPDGYGVDLLAALRQGPQAQVPVIVISAQGTDRDKVLLLDQGADDYLVKPFGIEELLARMRVAFRHRGRAVQAAVTRYACKALEVDLSRHRVLCNGEAVHLTPTEFKLLARLVRSVGQVVTHRQLLADVWGAEFTEHTHYLRLYMGQLRAKLEVDPGQPEYLLTEPGVGYRLAEPH
jgi:two-component system KDP operon response regulator KdpE